MKAKCISALRADVQRMALLPSSALCCGVPAPASLSVTLFQEIWCPVLRALGVRQRALRGWADGGSAVVLGYIEEAAKEDRESHMDTVTWDSGSSQIADAAGKIGQLEAAVQERCEASRRSWWASWWACRRSERGQRDHSACWCSQRERELLCMLRGLFGFSRVMVNGLWMELG